MKKETVKNQYDIAIVGTGIVGMSIAFASARQGLRVVMFERHPRAIGATVRNFGMVWPVGQPLETFDRAMRARETWLELAQKAGFWAAKTGALCLAYYDDEIAVLEEFFETRRDNGYQISLLTPEETLHKSKVINPCGLKGALWSATEVNIDPREATLSIHSYLQEELGVDIFYNTSISMIDTPWLSSGETSWRADRIFICSGADFETLYPDVFAESNLTKCKLQMMRTTHQPNGWNLGPTLCAGLTLQHYQSFAHCQSLEALKKRYATEMPDYNKWGIHVLVSQTSFGEVTIGDSHEYGLDLSPFDRTYVNDLILKYLSTFASFPRMEIAETWNGIYSKVPGKTEFIARPSEDVNIVNGLGGAGMTLSFGLAEELLSVAPVAA